MIPPAEVAAATVLFAEGILPLHCHCECSAPLVCVTAGIADGEFTSEMRNEPVLLCKAETALSLDGRVGLEGSGRCSREGSGENRVCSALGCPQCRGSVTPGPLIS